ncbi:MAG TPA: iron-sulfur cluster assembly accessory protein [Acidobacteriota bacterium]|nr:iron-sulfur cluster assembly accessory protein [Acidobacteriota bacterium]
MAVNVSESAAHRIREGLNKEGLPESGGMRLGVKGGGCAGLNYVMRFEEEQKPSDAVFEAHGARVFIDMKSLLFLKGMTLDWAGDFMQQGFQFQNPNAQETCSCGMSFQV